jgi:predicted lipoprotein with Yx(FWY)xxD motif
VQTHRPRTIARPYPARLLLATAALAGLLAALIAATQSSAATSSSQIKVASSTKYGKLLVDATGRTLYMFAPDKHGTSTCYGTCAHYWPPMIVSSTHVTATGVTMSRLGTTKRHDGRLQATYNGHPLYRFLKDTKAGQTNGEGLNLSGGLWWVLSPAGAPIKHAASGGGGYT